MQEKITSKLCGTCFSAHRFKCARNALLLNSRKGLLLLLFRVTNIENSECLQQCQIPPRGKTIVNKRTSLFINAISSQFEGTQTMGGRMGNRQVPRLTSTDIYGFIWPSGFGLPDGYLDGPCSSPKGPLRSVTVLAT